MKKIVYMLKHDFIEPIHSLRKVHLVLVPKPGVDTYRFCTDYRKVHSATNAAFYPVSRKDDYSDQIVNANYVKKMDLLLAGRT